MGKNGYVNGNSIRIGDNIAFILGFKNGSVSIMWSDGVRYFDIDSFSVCNVKRLSKNKCRKVYEGMKIRQLDGVPARITSKPRSSRYADIDYKGLHFERVEVLPFIQGTYKVEDGYLKVGRVEERAENLKNIGLTEEDLLEETYRCFEEHYGISIEQQKKLESARQCFLSELEAVKCEEERDALLNSWDKRNLYAEEESGGILKALEGSVESSDEPKIEVEEVESVQEAILEDDFEYDEYALTDEEEYFEEEDDIMLVEDDLTLPEDVELIIEEEVKIVSDDDALSEEVEIIEENSSAEGSKKKSVTLKGLGDGIIENKEKSEDEVKNSIRCMVAGRPESSHAVSYESSESTTLNKSLLKVGYSFRNKLGVLMTIIKVEKENITFALGNKGGKTCTLSMKNLRSVDTIDHVFGSRVGTKKPQVSGIVAEIVEDEDDRLTVRYENGSYQTNVSYDLFIEGKLFCPVERENYLRKQFKQKNGLIAMIVAYRNQDDISVLLSNGVFIENVKYSTIEKGELMLEGARGDSRRNALGMLATISKYRDRSNITVTFEDGSIVDNVTLDMFVEGDVMPDYIYKVGDQYRIGIISGITKARLSKGKYVFEGNCLLCKEKVEGTREMLLSHACSM